MLAILGLQKTPIIVVYLDLQTHKSVDAIWHLLNMKTSPRAAFLRLGQHSREMTQLTEAWKGSRWTNNSSCQLNLPTILIRLKTSTFHCYLPEVTMVWTPSGISPLLLPSYTQWEYWISCSELVYPPCDRNKPYERHEPKTLGQYGR